MIYLKLWESFQTDKEFVQKWLYIFLQEMVEYLKTDFLVTEGENLTKEICDSCMKTGITFNKNLFNLSYFTEQEEKELFPDSSVTYNPLTFEVVKLRTFRFVLFLENRNGNMKLYFKTRRRVASNVEDEIKTIQIKDITEAFVSENAPHFSRDYFAKLNAELNTILASTYLKIVMNEYFVSWWNEPKKSRTWNVASEPRSDKLFDKISPEVLDKMVKWAVVAPSTLNKLREIKPQLYQKIKNARQADQQWKTDLSADMGDLGF